MVLTLGSLVEGIAGHNNPKPIDTTWVLILYLGLEGPSSASFPGEG